MILTFVIAVIWQGCVLSLLWGWFAVPYGLRPISIPMAMGFALIVRFLTIANIPKRQSTSEITEALGFALGNAAVVLVMGWVIYLFS